MNSCELYHQFPVSPPRMRCDSMMFKFPARLWRIVNTCKTGAISWGPNGKTVRMMRSIFEKDFLQAEVNPFKTENFASFIRQLNLYGFKKVTAPMILAGEHIDNYDDLYEYRHPLFRQSKSELIPYIHRNCISKKKPTTNLGSKLSRRMPLGEMSVPKNKTDVPQQSQSYICHQSNKVIHTQEAVHKPNKTLQAKSTKKWIPLKDLENHPLLKPMNRISPKLQINPRLLSRSTTKPLASILYKPKPPRQYRKSVKMPTVTIVKENIPSQTVDPVIVLQNIESLIPQQTIEQTIPMTENQSTSADDECFNTSLNLDTFLVEHTNQPASYGLDTIETVVGDAILYDNDVYSVMDSQQTEEEKNDLYLLNKSIESHANSSIASEDVACEVHEVNEESSAEQEGSVGNTSGELSESVEVETTKDDCVGLCATIESNERYISIDISNLLSNDNAASHLIKLDSAILELLKQTEQTKALLDTIPVGEYTESDSSEIVGYVVLPPH